MNKLTEPYEGKVRVCHDLGFNIMALAHTNKQSGFDRYICDIPLKSNSLVEQAAWWFRNTRHICDNHYLSNINNVMFVKKCNPILLEVIVRGYITGSTKTSLWTHYNAGERTYCGIQFPDGLQKNQKLSNPVITPTTKGLTDELISGQEILDKGLLSEEEWTYISEVALKLFEFGQLEAGKKDLILVDTKYEFGYDSTGTLNLIDEIHTIDSSRYWKKSTYTERINAGKEPEKFDKDLIREYVKAQCDPYNDPIPEIPENIIQNVSKVYTDFTFNLTGNPLFTSKNLSTIDNNSLYSNILDHYMRYQPAYGIVHLLHGSEKDGFHVSKISNALRENHIPHMIVQASIHKNIDKVFGLVKNANAQSEFYQMINKPYRLVFITVAGMSNALCGTIAGNTAFPVITCPPFVTKEDMLVNIQSSLQCPSNVPVATVLNPSNAALFAKRILFN